MVSIAAGRPNAPWSNVRKDRSAVLRREMPTGESRPPSEQIGFSSGVDLLRRPRKPRWARGLAFKAHFGPEPRNFRRGA